MNLHDAVTARLVALGYTASESDFRQLNFQIEKAEALLKAKTNQTVLPEGLFFVLVDMAAGAFLQGKKAAGELGEVYDFSAPVGSISEGDVSVSFAASVAGSFEDQFDRMLAAMATPPDDVIAAYRRLVW